MWEKLSDFLKKPTLIFFILLFFLIFGFNLALKTGEHFSLLASSLLRGRMDLDISSLPDTVFWNGKYYLPLGPFPALLLVPFVKVFESLGLFFRASYLHVFFVILTFIFCMKIAREFKYNKQDAQILAFAFCFASVYQAVSLITFATYFSQVISVFLLLASIYLFLKGKRRYFLIGTLFAFIFMTRFTAGLGVIFFIYEIITNSNHHIYQKIKNLLALLSPVIVSGILLLGYNWLRFGNIFNNGYLWTHNWYYTREEFSEFVNHGLFSIKNIPTNIYYYFIKTPDPIFVDKPLLRTIYYLKPPFIKVGFPSTSFFIVSPIFLYLFKADLHKRLVRISLLPIIVILPLLLSFYYSGWVQVGPRYMLDLLPFAYLILLTSFRKRYLTRKTKYLIFASAAFNFYLFLSYLAFYTGWGSTG